MFQPVSHHFKADGVNPTRVPYKATLTGKRMPVIGLETFGSDHYSATTENRELGECLKPWWQTIGVLKEKSLSKS